MKSHWLDRITSPIAPRWTLKRQRARYAGEILARHYEGASAGRRTQGWVRPGTDANAAIGPGLAPLRNAVRDLVRNNPYAAAAVASIVNESIGWGIAAKSTNKRAMGLWKKWAETTACDADGRHDIYGLQKLALRTVAESGEVLIRRRFRLPSDGLPIPLQLQILEPDFLDTTKDNETLPNGGKIVQGVEFSPIGERVAYWLFRSHPGSTEVATFGASVRIPADGVIHMFRGDRPGQVRAVSWFAPSLLRFKDLDDFEDATLIKQKIAACLAAFVTDADGLTAPLGDPDDTKTPAIDSLQPGMISNLPPGRTVTVVDPPRSSDYASYTDRNLRGIAAGLRVLYESMTGDHTDLSFSAARMSRLAHQPDVDDWRWRLVIPQFCDPAWRWAMEAAAIAGLISLPASGDRLEAPPVLWSPPPLPFIDPAAEGLAIQRNVRTGITTMPEELRARGLDPAEVIAEIKAWNASIDESKIILDSDPRKMTQAGQAQTQAAPLAPAQPAAPGAGAGGEVEEDT